MLTIVVSSGNVYIFGSVYCGGRHPLLVYSSCGGPSRLGGSSAAATLPLASKAGARGLSTSEAAFAAFCLADFLDGPSPAQVMTPTVAHCHPAAEAEVAGAPTGCPGRARPPRGGLGIGSPVGLGESGLPCGHGARFCGRVRQQRRGTDTQNFRELGSEFTGINASSAESLREKLQRELEAEHVEFEDTSANRCAISIKVLVVSSKLRASPCCRGTDYYLRPS
ncbi:hypothetical protein NDU88_002866 [Pleurodeles waltl]|uniref:Uncharacterized protein n=1 Tax=Pleurodeles waltl TaxID=8319 RepID=A0AAV7M3R6_PLEWA|nr:hypothetical protein NDU88_002866 [Pleurodeles waltl]